MMKGISPRPLLIFACSVAVGAVAGIALRTWWFSNPKMSAISVAGQTNRTVAFPDATVLPDRSTRFSNLAKALAKIPRAQRYLWLAAQMENASLTEVDSLFRLAGIEGHTDLQRAIAARWAKLDPSHMFEAMSDASEYDHPIVRILFEQWAQSDPQNALKHVVENKRTKWYPDFGKTLWNQLMKHAPATGFAAYGQLGIIGYLPDTRHVGAWARSDPRAAAELLVSQMNDQPAGRETMKEIAKVWGESDPGAALTFGLQLEDQGYRYTVLVNSMKAWARQDPEAAAHYIAGQSDAHLRATLGSGLVAGLAETDPKSALAWAEENLQSAARADAISEAVETVAQQDIDAAAAMVAGMEPGGAMNVAVSQVVREWAEKGVTDNDAMWTWIESLTDIEARERAVQGLEWRLQRNARDGLVDFVSGKHGHLATKSIVERAARQRARQDAPSAANWASSLPEDRSSTALEAVMDYWRGVSTSEAAAWESAEQR